MQWPLSSDRDWSKKLDHQWLKMFDANKAVLVYIKQAISIMEWKLLLGTLNHISSSLTFVWLCDLSSNASIASLRSS